MRSISRIGSVLVLGVMLSVLGCKGADAEKSQSGSFLSGAQLFALKDTSGAEVKLETVLQEHKAVLINFWATWCPPCREEIPQLIQLQKDYQEKGFTVLGVNVSDSAVKTSAFVKKSGINYPNVLDTDQLAVEAYKIVGIPTSVLVGSDKKIIGVYYGFTDELVSDLRKQFA